MMGDQWGIQWLNVKGQQSPWSTVLQGKLGELGTLNMLGTGLEWPSSEDQNEGES